MQHFPTRPQVKERAANDTDNAFESIISVVATPTTEFTTLKGQKTLELIIIGAGANDATGSVRVIGMRSVTVAGAVIWVPTVICELAVVLSTEVGVAGAPVVATDRIADAMTLTYGLAVIPTVPANTVCRAFVPIDGFEKYKLSFARSTATDMNALVCLY